MKTIIFKHVHHINTDELDFLLREQVIPDIGEDEDHDEIYSLRTGYYNKPIKIETLRGHLDELEERGANFVSIDFHIDHIEYELDGILVREATQEEINIEANRNKEIELKKLNYELARIEKTANNFREQIKTLEG